MTCVKSSAEVYLRILGPEHSEKFEALVNQMNSFYNSFAFPSELARLVDKVDQPLAGKLYAARVGGSWDRVLVEEVMHEGLFK